LMTAYRIAQHFQDTRSRAGAQLYSVEAVSLREVDAWLDRFRGFWEPRLDALATEIARGKRKRRLSGKPS
jgi:hypothetical protein